MNSQILGIESGSTHSMESRFQIVFATSCEDGRAVRKNTRHGEVCLCSVAFC